MKETTLQCKCRELAESMWWLSFRGHSVHRNGVADYSFMKAGHGFVVEFKKRKTGKKSMVQDSEELSCKIRAIPYYEVRTLLQMREVLLIEEAKFTKEELANMEV